MKYKCLVFLAALFYSTVSLAEGNMASAVNHSPQITSQIMEEFWQMPLENAQGEVVQLSSFKGRPLLVNFWATWCAPCLREMPLLDSLSKEYSDIQFLGIALDSAKNIQKFGEKVSVSYPLLRADMRQLKFVRQLGNPKGGLPFTLSLTETGEIAAIFLGELHEKTAKEMLQPLKLD